MKRVSLFEFGDQPWFPEPLRSCLTAYLAAVYAITPFPKLWAERLARVLEAEPEAAIVDLASGSGGPMPIVLAELATYGKNPRVTLTDLRPRPGGHLPYWPEPVDALSVPAELPGILTIFAAFHHFPPARAQEILKNAFAQRRAVCVFEATSRSPAAIVSTVLIPLLALLFKPRVRPVSWTQIAFTYLIPILPPIIFWDGLVSQLRTYTEEELRMMIRDLRSPDYVWEVGSCVAGPGAAAPWLVGHKMDRCQSR